MKLILSQSLSLLLHKKDYFIQPYRGLLKIGKNSNTEFNKRDMTIKNYTTHHQWFKRIFQNLEMPREKEGSHTKTRKYNLNIYNFPDNNIFPHS